VRVLLTGNNTSASPGGWRNPRGRVDVCGPRRGLLTLRCPYSPETSIKPPPMMTSSPATTLIVGWLASETVTSCIAPIKMTNRDGTSHGRPRRKVTVHHMVFDGGMSSG